MTELESLRLELAAAKEELVILRQYARPYSILDTFTQLRSLLKAREEEIRRLEAERDTLSERLLVFEFPHRPGGLAARLFRRSPR